MSDGTESSIAWTCGEKSSVRSCGIQQRPISQDMLKIYIIGIILKTIDLKLQLQLPEPYELQIPYFGMTLDRMKPYWSIFKRSSFQKSCSKSIAALHTFVMNGKL